MFADKCGHTALSSGLSAAFKHIAKALKSWLCDDSVMVQRVNFFWILSTWRKEQSTKKKAKKKKMCDLVRLTRVLVWVPSSAVLLSSPHSLRWCRGVESRCHFAVVGPSRAHHRCISRCKRWIYTCVTSTRPRFESSSSSGWLYVTPKILNARVQPEGAFSPEWTVCVVNR